MALVWIPGLWYSAYIGFPTVYLKLALVILTTLYFLSKHPVVSIAEALVIAYAAFLGITLALLSALCSGAVDSSLKATVSAGLLALCYIVSRRFIFVLYNEPVRVSFWINLIICAAFFSFMVGFVFLDDFRGGSGGFRLTGGVNPNTVGQVAYFGLVWGFLSKEVTSGWRTDSALVVVASTIALLWSFSRASILAALVFLVIVVVVTLIRLARSGLVKRSFITTSFLLFISGLTLGVFAKPLLTLAPVGAYIVERLNMGQSSGLDSNLGERLIAWRYLLDEFSSCPLTGSLGWYNATYFLDDLGGGVASSPHSLYVRLLSEVGVMGVGAILIFPLAVAALGFILSVINDGRTGNRSSKVQGFNGSSGIRKYASAGLFGIFFGREFFEDSYMTEYISFTTLFVLLLSAMVVTCARKRPFETFTS